MQTYISHKRVQAAEIIYVGNYDTDDKGATVRRITLAGGEEVTLPAETFARYVPLPGDFYVVYEDGYKSFSPRKAFLEGYTAEGQSFADIKEGLKR
jgi:hypothetical protein